MGYALLNLSIKTNEGIEQIINSKQNPIREIALLYNSRGNVTSGLEIQSAKAKSIAKNFCAKNILKPQAHFFYLLRRDSFFN